MLKYGFIALAMVILFACSAEKDAPSQNAVTSLPEATVEIGVSLDLAKARVAAISELNYALTFKVPTGATEPIRAQEILTFNLASVSGDLQLDFREAADNLETLGVNGVVTEIVYHDEHLLLPGSALKVGANRVEVTFIAGDTSLNRNPDYLYTLFVPDRARTAFPVFDQPNLKATYDLTLNLPGNWEALGNAPLESVEPAPENATRRVHRFKRSNKLSSYLFSFVAGEFETITRTINGRQMTMFHREPNEAKVERNVDDIFQAHADALDWLEAYTGIDYPFQKFDFALIPTFQYGGMEHVGAIQYRASTLFLDEDPSDPQRLNRANLIAHETAHMWFGDLVTMEWFNDVWTKEVFANFMAAKIVNPSFPDIDHDLNFLLRSYPGAYAVDRTSGANPIRQHLPNLNEAGNLYGGIIYNKAPIMMKQLELLLGEDTFRDGMREYLSTYAWGNATWPDLIDILDERSEQDLRAWSEVWVNTAGRPHFRLGDPSVINLKQIDPSEAGRIWPQRVSYSQAKGVGDQYREFTASEPTIQLPRGGQILFNANGEGYGLFPVDLLWIEQQWARMSDLQKGAQLINMFEQMLEGPDQFTLDSLHPVVTPIIFFEFLEARLDEPNELLLNTMLGQLRRTYWSFITDAQRAEAISRLEPVLWAYIENANLPPSTRKIYFRTLQDIAAYRASHMRLRAILEGEAAIAGISLSARERGDLASLLAIKMPSEAEDILGRYAAWLQNEDERRRFAFIAPALSADQAVRDAFFTSLLDVENRAIESWVVDALAYLHHPERIETSQAYILQSLELMEDIQVTGDIFFPGRWITGTLQNHHYTEVTETVRAFLVERPDYNYQLKLKILQAADMLYRAEEAQNIAP